ncbi:NAD-dependent epimerase/dehydratase family protein [Croceicoccus marinus]|uniref:NAD-dependent dehydratase n=1 Tax=Croceicoccus marinus TaxID=450378 RepID=A0A1Z1FD91_9SPHN|nr:SDR family oxidoreductase [Croceicoccus marinus]ARU16712.1 NAD-dependent dehydratase [Croceicoccus marinus]
MKILVTGHAGYIGSVLVPMLLDRGHDLAGLDSELFAACDFGAPPAAIPSLGQDIRDFIAAPDAVERLAGFDAVIHLAGLSNDALGDYRPDLADTINCTASIVLARMAKLAGVSRFLFGSSCSAYGDTRGRLVGEGEQLRPITPHAVASMEVEHALMPLADRGFSPVCLRGATAYGPSPRLRFDLVVNSLVAWAFTRRTVRLKSEGSAWRPLVHVEDLAAAFVAAVEAPPGMIHRGVFNVGRTEENFRVRDIARLVRDMMPGTLIAHAEDAARDPRSYRVRCDHVRRVLPGWHPRWTCREGIAQLLDLYAAQGLAGTEFDGPRYDRMAHLRHRVATGTADRDFYPVEQKIAA